MNFWLHLLIVLAILLLSVMMYNRTWLYDIQKEGFQQQDKFLLKTNKDSYDDFYAEIYTTVNDYKKLQRELDEIIKMTMASKEKSVFLDIGSGTGEVVQALTTLGYNAFGIEESKEMITSCHAKYPQLHIKHEDVNDPMAYNRAVFTHILCLNFTLYEFVNKLQLFKNCHFWLKGNGYLILHLSHVYDEIDDTISNVSNEPASSFAKRKIELDFPAFSYRSEILTSKLGETYQKETFIDRSTQNVRQNERILYTESVHDILEKSVKAGFIVKGRADFHDGSGDFLYILERLK